MTSQLFSASVQNGSKIGRKIGSPTINLDPTLLEGHKEGVYAATVTIEKQIYRGALYYGPRLVKNETNNVLEIHVFDFNKQIYGEIVTFQVYSFIRPVLHFSSLKELKEQISKDIEEIKRVFNEKISI